nr:hypothetical protein 10 [Dehalococcoidia bacterium]
MRRIAEKKAKEEAERLRKEAEEKRQAELRAQEKEREEALQRQRELKEQAKAEGVEAPEVEIPEVDEELKKPVTVDDIAVDQPTTQPTKTAEGTAYQSKVWDFKLINLSLVPHQYLQLDEKKVRQAIKAGTRKISGIDIFEKADVRFRTK